MINLIYGIGIGICIMKIYDEIRLIIIRRRMKKEAVKLKEAMDGFAMTIRKFFHEVEDDLQRESKKGKDYIAGPIVGVPFGGGRVSEELTIDQQIVIAIENDDFEEAARLRDIRDGKK